MCSIQQDTAHQLRRSGASTLLFSFVILIQAMNLLHGTASKNPPRSPHEHYIDAELITTKQQLNQSFFRYASLTKSGRYSIVDCALLQVARNDPIIIHRGISTRMSSTPTDKNSNSVAASSREGDLNTRCCNSYKLCRPLPNNNNQDFTLLEFRPTDESIDVCDYSSNGSDLASMLDPSVRVQNSGNSATKDTNPYICGGYSFMSNDNDDTDKISSEILTPLPFISTEENNIAFDNLSKDDDFSSLLCNLFDGVENDITADDNRESTTNQHQSGASLISLENEESNNDMCASLSDSEHSKIGSAVGKSSQQLSVLAKFGYEVTGEVGLATTNHHQDAASIDSLEEVLADCDWSGTFSDEESKSISSIERSSPSLPLPDKEKKCIPATKTYAGRCAEKWEERFHELKVGVAK
jgi:hypothetical protein